MALRHWDFNIRGSVSMPGICPNRDEEEDVILRAIRVAESRINAFNDMEVSLEREED